MIYPKDSTFMFRKRSCYLRTAPFFSEKKQPEYNKKSSRRWNESRQYTLDIVSLPSEKRIIISEGWTSSGILGDVDPPYLPVHLSFSKYIQLCWPWKKYHLSSTHIAKLLPFQQGSDQSLCGRADEHRLTVFRAWTFDKRNRRRHFWEGFFRQLLMDVILESSPTKIGTQLFLGGLGDFTLQASSN